MRAALRVLPWVVVALLLAGSFAQASGHQPALDGLVETLKAMVSAFSKYLESLT